MHLVTDSLPPASFKQFKGLFKLLPLPKRFSNVLIVVNVDLMFKHSVLVYEKVMFPLGLGSYVNYVKRI